MPAAELPEKVTFTRVGLLFTVLKRAPPLGDEPDPPVSLFPLKVTLLRVGLLWVS